MNGYRAILQDFTHKSPITEEDLPDLVHLYFNKTVTIIFKKSLRIMVLFCSLQIQFCLQ